MGFYSREDGTSNMRLESYLIALCVAYKNILISCLLNRYAILICSMKFSLIVSFILCTCGKKVMHMIKAGHLLLAKFHCQCIE